MDHNSLQQLGHALYREMLQEAENERNGHARGEKLMDSLITGSAMAQAYIHEISQESASDEFWEPKPSWLQRFGTTVLSRLGLMQAQCEPTETVVQEPVSEAARNSPRSLSYRESTSG